MFESKLYKNFFPIFTEEEFSDFCYFYKAECLKIIDTAISKYKYEILALSNNYNIETPIHIYKINKKIEELEELRIKCNRNCLDLEDANLILILSNKNIQDKVKIFERIFIGISLILLFLL